MAIDEHLTEHARGAMIGLAIGDALGMPTQSMSAERIIECYGEYQAGEEAGSRAPLVNFTKEDCEPSIVYTKEASK